MKKTGTLLLSVVLLFGVSGRAQQSADYIVEKDVAVPMRDGVILRADILRPKTGGRFPTLVYRTPYGKEFALRGYSTFRRAVERGYAVVVQDVRGRYASDGEFSPYQHEGQDGYATIEWAATQRWSDGSVGTFGLSYPGAVQWLAAVENPPHLKAMIPAMTFSTPKNFFYAGGTWDMSWIEWIWDNIASDARVRKHLPGPMTYEEAKAAWKELGPHALGALPLSSVTELRDIAPYYYEWLRHPVEDPWWDWCELRNKYDRVHAAVLNLSAWYDDNYGPEGATTNFAGLLKARAEQGASDTHLLLGPWVHGGTESAKAGDRKFAPAAAIDYDEVLLRWLDHYVRGIDNGVNREKPVRYFVMGTDEWREADSWPPWARETAYYLSSEKHRLSPLPPHGNDRYSSFISDPANPVTNAYSSSGAHDYRSLGRRKDVLTFDSSPLTANTEVTGQIRAKVFLACDCKDADLWVRLLDVAPDGTAFNLMNPGLDVLRASYRDGGRTRQLLKPGQIYELDLNNLITSNVFLKGHKIRVQVSGSFVPNFSRNLQTGVLENNSAKMRAAEIRIYEGTQHPSQIILPVIETARGK